MGKRARAALGALLAAALCASALGLAACAGQGGVDYEVYRPDKSPGGDSFDFESNSFAAEVTLDGVLDDDRWKAEDVVRLGSWDGDETEGAIVYDLNDYAGSKTAVIRMFRGQQGYHFGFEVRDVDVVYKALNDGDDAIWTDNILVNLDTGIDGSTVPMPDDYYFIVTAFGNNCFRRGAGFAGSWGSWTGLIDYQAALVYGDASNPEKATGYGIEMMIPYEQIGVTKDSPIALTFRRCDRLASGAMVEREWLYKGTHHFNTPNEYVIWGEDNLLYTYYAYEMPPVTLTGQAVDYVTGAALAGVRFENADKSLSAVSDDSGRFKLENVPANLDLELNAADDSLLKEQKVSVGRDVMRSARGGEVSQSFRLFTKDNMVTAVLSGVVRRYAPGEGLAPAVGTVVRVGNLSATAAADGSYELSGVPFADPAVAVRFEYAGRPAVEEYLTVEQAASGKVTLDAEIPVASAPSAKFGAAGDVTVSYQRTSRGLGVLFTADSESAATLNGYGVALDFAPLGEGGGDAVYLLHKIGTLSAEAYGRWTWPYAPPESYGVTVRQEVTPDGRRVWRMIIPYDRLGIQPDAEFGACAFEYTSAGTFSYFRDAEGTLYAFDGGLGAFPTFCADGSLKFPQSFTTARFGSSGATAKFQAAPEGIRVTFTGDAGADTFGYGVCLDLPGLGTTGSPAEDVSFLYSVEFGTLSKLPYGQWLWAYDAPSKFGVTATQTEADGVRTVTLLISYESLGISATCAELGVCVFEVVNAGGEYLAIYHLMRDESGNIVYLDGGVTGFVRWRIREEEA